MNREIKWEEFRESGLLWLVNSFLHVFGWAIAVNYDSDMNFLKAYPARTKFRGFSEDINADGYIRVSKYLEKHAQDKEIENENIS